MLLTVGLRRTSDEYTRETNGADMLLIGESAGIAEAGLRIPRGTEVTLRRAAAEADSRI